ncbi:MAG: hypothetical protein WC657_06440 [Candidatus Paceibacterota bacterium]|jgi:hypothetical protein
MFTLNKNDWVRGLIVAVGGSVFVAITAVLNTIITTPGFDVFLLDWGVIGHNLVNLTIVSAYAGFSGYIFKNVLTTDSGKALGVVGK